MTAVVAQPLLTAVKAAVEASGIPFGDADKPTTVAGQPWIVCWADAGIYGAKSLAGGDAWSLVLVAHCVGLSAEAARIASAKLAAALYSLHRTTVGGRVVLYPENLSSQPLQRDDDPSPPLYVQIVEWRLSTTPA